MSETPPPSKSEARAKFRRTLVQVLVVQAVALAVLAFLQIRYGS
ncbi:MAG: hypothetical protein U5R14_14195 [Gemmatimonadota bacterium]|nr:hypothetical protein [Gemmatimonadota bacterium]